MDVTEVVIVSTAVITATTMIRNAREKKFHFSTVVFGFLLTIVLLLIAVPAPGFAKALAYLGLVGAFAVNGPVVFNTVNGIGAANGKGKTVISA